MSEKFFSKLSELEDSGRAGPVIRDDRFSFIYVPYSNLYVLALARNNCNAVAILAFLHKLIEIFKHYFREVSGDFLLFRMSIAINICFVF